MTWVAEKLRMLQCALYFWWASTTTTVKLRVAGFILAILFVLFLLIFDYSLWTALILVPVTPLLLLAYRPL